MTLRDKLIEALGTDYTTSDDLAIERIETYYEIFKQTQKDVKAEGYRRRTTPPPLPGIRPEGNERYFLNLAFTVMNDCSKQIRADLELLGLSKKGKRLEITSKIDTGLSLLEQMNQIKDE